MAQRHDGKQSILRSGRLLLLSGFLGIGLQAQPVLKLPRLTGDKDYSAQKAQVTVVEAGGISDGYPDLTYKTLTATLKAAIKVAPLSISFQFIPDTLTQTKVIFKTSQLEIAQSKTAMVSRFLTKSGTWDSLVNTGGGLQTRRSNHIAVVIENGKHKSYVNGQAQEHAIPGSDTRMLDSVLIIGPFPGEVWDVQVYAKALSLSEVDELAKFASMKLVTNGPHAGMTKVISRPYVRIWTEPKHDLSQDRFTYYLQSCDREWSHLTFKVGVYPHGKLDEYVFDESRRDWNLFQGLIDEYAVFTYANPMNITNFHRYVHEHAHWMQGNASQRIGWGANSFFLEAFATWAMQSMYPGFTMDMLGHYTLMPHLPLWTELDADVGTPIGKDFSGGHMYGSYVFFSYITDNLLDDGFMGEIINDRRLGTAPVAAMNDILKAKGLSLKTVFGDFAVKTPTFDYANGDAFAVAENVSRKQMKDVYPDVAVRDAEFAAAYGGAGTGTAWKGIPAGYEPGGWAYNAYKVAVARDTGYKIEFQGLAKNPDSSSFEVRACVYTPGTKKRVYYSLPTDSAVSYGKASTGISVNAKAGDTLYFVVATTPPTVFKGYTRKYHYQYRITPQAQTVTGVASGGTIQGVPVKFSVQRSGGNYTLVSQERIEDPLVFSILSLDGTVVENQAMRISGPGSHAIAVPPLGKGIYLFRVRGNGIDWGTKVPVY